MSRRTHRRRQRGVALITVLLVVAVVSVIASAMIARQQVSIRSSANQLHARQAWHYALGGEALAKAILSRDAAESTLDHPGEAWAQPLPAYPIEHGEIRVRIEDLSGRFNVNSLNQGDGKEAVRQFRRLLQRLGIRNTYTSQLVDWLDMDQEPTGDRGAEDGAYQRLKTPYRTAGRALQDVSELRLLLGMTDEDYQRLLPYVVALPENAPLNVNSLSAPVLASLGRGLAVAVAETALRERPEEGFTDLASFLTQPALADIQLQGTELAVGSQFFRATSEVQLGERRQVLVSLLKRESDGSIRVLRRDLGQAAPVPSASDEES